MDRSDPDLKIIRSKKPEVRTGCKTCKKRRVKCDEVKPKCRRCIIFGICCDGYAETFVHTKPLAPKLLIPRLCPVAQQSPIYQLPSRSLFRSQQEYRYFQVFCTKTSYHLSGFFSSKFWRVLVLQVCETDASIRHAIVALGALNFAAPHSNKISQIKQRQFAFREYSKAISEIRKRIAGQKVGAHGNWGHQSLRCTLMACLLFACFEAFHGFLDAAITQIHVGVRMIEEWLISLEQCSDVNKMTSITSPRPAIIEDEVIHIFLRLDLESLSSRKNSSAESRNYQRFFGQYSMDAMPTQFVDLAEARTYLELVERRSAHWMTWMEVKREKNLTLCFSHAQEAEASDELLLEKEMMLCETSRWVQAFEWVWQYSQREAGKSTFLGALVLKIQGLVSYVCKNSVACSKEFLYATSLSWLREIVHLAKVLIDLSTALPVCTFAFDVHTIFPLAVVGLRFRHRTLRWEAIALLLKGPWSWREGVWDSWVFGNAIQWIADIEEEGLTDEGAEVKCEYVPEENIVREVQMEHDVGARRTTVTCLQPVKEMGGEIILRQLEIPWL